MARSSRMFKPASRHHVMKSRDRAADRLRIAFTGRDDTRYFLSRIARAVRRQIEVHAY